MASTPTSSSSSSPQLHLPDECWETVFMHLTDPLDHETLSLVSPNFLSLTNRLRTSLTVTDRLLPLFPALLRRFPNLTSIQIHGFFTGDLNTLLTQIASSDLPSLHSIGFSRRPAYPSTGLRNFALKFPTLKSLDCFQIAQVEPTDFELIASCFPNLEELNLSLCKPRDQHDGGGVVAVFGGAVEAMASKLQKLRKVMLCLSFLRRGTFILHFCRNCESLEELHLGCITALLKQGDIAEAIRLRPGLKSLTVNATGPGLRIVSSELLDALLTLKMLTCLDLSDMVLSDVSLCAVADSGLPLRKLNLCACSGFSRFGFSYLLSKCNLLQHLNLWLVELIVPLEDPFVEWSLFLPNLITLLLGIGGNLIVTELSFFAVVRNCPLITETRMAIGEDSTGFGTTKLDEASLASLMSLAGNSRLKNLDLRRNERLKDESFMMIASVCPNLEVINLRKCSSITDHAALEVLKRCPKIRSLDVAYSGVAQFLVDFQVPTLLALNLSGLEISDETLLAISKNCCWLRCLRLECCKEITDKGVKKVVENCKQLRMMSLKSCEKVAADVVPWIVFARPSLRMLIPPPSFILTDSQTKLFLRHGCHVYYEEIVFYYPTWLLTS